MNVTDLILKVRTVINEIAVEEDVFTWEVEHAIRQLLQTAMLQIASMPSYRGEPVMLSNDDAVVWQKRPDGLYYATVKCGNDFLRPVSVNVSGWVRPVFQFLPVTNNSFLAQYSSAPGIGNGPMNPVAFIAKDPDIQIIAHASPKIGEVTLRYIPVPKINEDDSLDCPDMYVESLVYTAAGLYLQSVNEYDAAKSSFDTAASILQTINNQEQ